MLKYLIGTISILLVMVSVALATSFQTVDVVTGEWPPYTNSQLPEKGMASEIIKAVFNDIGYAPNITFLPFYLGYEKTLGGEFDGTFPYFKTSDREELFYFSEPLFRVPISVYFNKYNPEIKEQATSDMPLSVNNLQDYCVGLIQGYDYGNLEEQIVQANNRGENQGKYRRYNNEINAFRALINSSLDQAEKDIGVVEDNCGGEGVKLHALPSATRVGNAILKNYFRDERHQIGELTIDLGEDQSKAVHFMTPKNDRGKKLIDQFNTSLKKLKENDFVATIEKSYLDSDPESSTGLVRLTGSDSFPLVVGYEPLGTEVKCPPERRFWGRQDQQLLYHQNCAYLIPRGTRALIVEWGEPFVQPGQVEIHEQLLKPSRVEILEGPLKDKELYVSNVYIEFE